MTEMHKVESDLLYVRSLVERSENSGAPPSIHVLWALVSAVGFPLQDFRPEWVGAFWTVAGPLGGVLSFLLGWRWGVRQGQGSLKLAKYHALHWGGMLVAIFLAVPLHVREGASPEVLARTILLILAFGWYVAGIYLVRDYLWMGLVLGVGYVAMFFLDSYSWTALGILFAISLLWAAFHRSRVVRPAD